MDQLLRMKVFVAVAETQGFSAAARRLDMSAPAVTRAVASLEDSLGVKLLQRTTRLVRATEAGLRYLEDIRKILEDVETATEAARGINSEPRGHLTVTAPVLFGRKFVMPGITEYLSRYPEAQVDAVFLDRVVNMLEEGLDVGVRIGALPDSTMKARKVGRVRMVVVGSPDYLHQHGIVQVPEQLHDHTLIVSRAGNMSQDWRFMTTNQEASDEPARGKTGKEKAGKEKETKERKKEKTVRVEPRLTVTTNDAAVEAAKQGLGLTRILSYQVADELAAGELKIVLENYEMPSLPVHIVHREGRLASTKVRAFIDLMVERLGQDGALN